MVRYRVVVSHAAMTAATSDDPQRALSFLRLVEEPGPTKVQSLVETRLSPPHLLQVPPAFQVFGVTALGKQHRAPQGAS
jgi:hypothetical protein